MLKWLDRVTIATAAGVPPLLIPSMRPTVPNLDCDLLDGYHATAFAMVTHVHDWASIVSKPTTFTPSAHATSHQPGQPDYLALDHSWMFGLNNDDHPHYLNNTRGDARYLQKAGGTLTGDLTVPGVYSATNLLQMRGAIWLNDFAGVTHGEFSSQNDGTLRIRASSMLELRGVQVQVVGDFRVPGASSGDPVACSLYFDAGASRLYVHNGSAWKSVLLT